MSSKIFVGNLSYDTTQTQLQELLGEVGEIKDVYLPADRVSGRPRGFAFVEFSTEEQAKAPSRSSTITSSAVES